LALLTGVLPFVSLGFALGLTGRGGWGGVLRAGAGVWSPTPSRRRLVAVTSRPMSTRPILDVADELGVAREHVIVNPTPAGEGKTTTSVGLAMGLNRRGKRRAVAALREPSLGPVFGVKGGGTGGGSRRSNPRRTSTSTSRATSTPSPRRTTSSRPSRQRAALPRPDRPRRRARCAGVARST
jgi:hypothetical protein